MQSFQNWMQCRQYFAHIKNLVKIKRSTNSESLHHKPPKHCQHRRPFSISSVTNQSRKSREIAVRSQDKEDQIYRQNISLAERLMNVPSVISYQQQISSYDKYRSLLKKTQNRRKQEQFREKKLNNFLAIKGNCHSQSCRYLMTVSLSYLNKMPEDSESHFWIELTSGRQKVLSQQIMASELLLHQVRFPLKREIESKTVRMKIHVSRKLDYLNFGEYDFQVPKLNQQLRNVWALSHDQIHKINFSVKYVAVIQKTRPGYSSEGQF